MAERAWVRRSRSVLTGWWHHGAASRRARFFGVAQAGQRRVVRAITSPVNHGSIAFHTALGFTVTGPVRDYDGPSIDRILFERRLGT